jgi:hypothetical protein
VNETTQLALSALAIVGSIVSTVVAGYILSVIKSSRARTLADIAQLGLQLTQESEERRSSIAIEAKERQDGIDRLGDILRTKAENLGKDIVEIEKRMAYDRGVARKPFREGD